MAKLPTMETIQDVNEYFDQLIKSRPTKSRPISK